MNLFDLIKQMEQFEEITKGPIPSSKTKFNVAQKEKDLKIELILPGFKKEDIEIELKGDRLSIKALAKKEKDSSEVFIWRDFEMKNYEQVLSLPKDFNYETAEASYDAGILTINLNGVPKVTGNKITIK